VHVACYCICRKHSQISQIGKLHRNNLPSSKSFGSITRGVGCRHFCCRVILIATCKRSHICAYINDSRMKRVLALVVYVSLCSLAADCLQCNSCHFDTFNNQTECETTHRTCSPQETFCFTYMDERWDGTKSFSKGCAGEVCGTGYCQSVINDIGRKSCNVSCCQEDLCNRDGYQPITSLSVCQWSFSCVWFIMITLLLLWDL